LASGRLCRDWRETTKRYESDQVAKGKYNATADVDKPVVDRVKELAERRGLTRTQIALAWLLQKDPVTIPIVRITKIPQLEDAAASVPVTLTPEEAAFLEEPYVPHNIVGHT
jgi:aryl-alcohol dehydrogenase-like predicted oxidoreductase